MASMDEVVLTLHSKDDRHKTIALQAETTLTLSRDDVLALRADPTEARFIASCEVLGQDGLFQGGEDEVLFEFEKKLISSDFLPTSGTSERSLPLRFEDTVGWTALDEDAPGPFGFDEVYARMTLEEIDSAEKTEKKSESVSGTDFGDRTA
jgi:hypothetical protein